MDEAEATRAATSTKVDTVDGAHVLTIVSSSSATAASPKKANAAIDNRREAIEHSNLAEVLDEVSDTTTDDANLAEVLDERTMWRTKFIAYYESNAPDKTHMVTEKMMATWEGRYETLYSNLEKKYGVLGVPKPQKAAAPKPQPPHPLSQKGGTVFNYKKGDGITDFRAEIMHLVAQDLARREDLSAASLSQTTPNSTTVVDAKAEFLGEHGFELSSFTVCARVRPMSASEASSQEGDIFEALFKGADAHKATAREDPAEGSVAHGAESAADSVEANADAPVAAKGSSNLKTSETAVLLRPRLTITGVPKLEPKVFEFDHVFGPLASEESVFQSVGLPLVQRALAGQAGTIFAYGQTGSGKTWTMSNLMSRVSAELFRPKPLDGTGEGGSSSSSSSSGSSGGSGSGSTAPLPAKGRRTVTFSYLEVQGQACRDCLNGGAAVSVGELLDGSVVLKGLSKHACSNQQQLDALVAAAAAVRATEATERNEASSRSHGIGILRVSPETSPEEEDEDEDDDFLAAAGGSASSGSAAATSPEDGSGAEAARPRSRLSDGVLHVIDLAGSESAADSKGHDKQRIAETKAINVSLMALKDCVRARTEASKPGKGFQAHVPYRRSKLTLLMKDVFDVCGQKRRASTVVVACVSPLARDAAHSNNTLSYAAPLRTSALANEEAKSGGGKGGGFEVDGRDPCNWSNAALAEWLTSQLTALSAKKAEQGRGGGGGGGGKVKEEAAAAVVVDGALTPAKEVVDPAAVAAKVAGGLTGAAFCALSEADVHRRVRAAFVASSNSGGGSRAAAVSAPDQTGETAAAASVAAAAASLAAAALYGALWAALVDAKVRARKPDGTLVTAEEEAANVAQAEEAQLAKDALWKSREEHLNTEH